MQPVVLALIESALRSALLGLLVSAGVGLFRLRDLKAETAIWTLVLAAAMAMPVLVSVLPPLMPRGLDLPALGAAGRALTLQASAPVARAPLLPLVLALVYGGGVLFFLARLAAGLVLLARLYLEAEPAPEAWARGRAVRFSAAIDGPLSFAHCILLPADYRQWPETHRAAVMAHEECHIRRGDFFIQLAAAFHRALFWFSPFAWWLQRKLGELAETASDVAGAQRIGDPASYAEILIDVTREARRRPVTTAVAMAHGPGLAKRVDHILTPPTERALGVAGRAAALASVAAVSLTLAEFHGAVAQAVQAAAPKALSHPLSSRRTEARKPLTRAASRHSVAARASSSARHIVKAPAEIPAPSAVVAEAEQPSYDPLAALRDHDRVAVLPVLLTGRGVAQ
jgi:beta-lactamase regulating signal transducer with metallopeptidase domain